MIAQELEVSLHMAFVEARQKRHEFITVEHLLLALIDNPSAAEALRACGGKPESLRKDLTNFINEHTPTVSGEDDIDTQPTLGFQRVIQRAILHVQSSGKKEVNGANVLVAIYGEKDSHAVYFLQKQGITRLDVVNFISHGISKVPQQKTSPEGEVETEGEKEQSGPLEQYTINLNALALQGKIDPLIGRDKETRARHPDPVPPAQEQPAAGRRSRRRQDGHCRRSGPQHRRGRCPGHSGQGQRLFAGHGVAAGRHQVPRRLRAAPQGGHQAAAATIPTPSCSSMKSIR
jgi:hypothetical protein